MQVQLSSETLSAFAAIDVPDGYQRIKSETEARVAEWRWATWEMFDPEPFCYEKFKLPKGRWLRSEPDPARMPVRWQHGLDAQGRVIVIRRTCKLPGVIAESFFRYSDALIEETHFGSSVKDNPVYSRLQIEEGLPIRREAKASNSLAISTYEHEAGRLVREHRISDSLSLNNRMVECNCSFLYDQAGRLDRIDCEIRNVSENEPFRSRLLYRRPRKGESVKELSEKIAAQLLEQIPQTLAKAQLSDPVFNLLLVYDAENDLLPPALALGPESLRRRAVDEHGKEARYELWNPADYPYFNTPELELTDPELLESCRLLNQVLSQRDNCQPARRLLNSVAAELQRRDWRGILNTTDDFIVTAVDLESQDDLQANLKKSVPAELIKQLKRECLL